MEAGWLGLALLGQGVSLPMVLQQLPERTALCFQGPQQRRVEAPWSLETESKLPQRNLVKEDIQRMGK